MYLSFHFLRVVCYDPNAYLLQANLLSVAASPFDLVSPGSLQLLVK